jgi:hypothetical protein
VAGTWTRVLFDGRGVSTWAGDNVEVPAGTEKTSDVVLLQLDKSKDYYVTFKINSPSVYLNPPASYRELYFESADHTQDIQWSGSGYSTTQDFHALSSIYWISPYLKIIN